ncbi:MAG: hypothetical protein ACTSSK_07950 [Candidatus Heimdallarchaeota archaeon]
MTAIDDLPKGYTEEAHYKVVYLRADCCSCTTDIPATKVEDTCNTYRGLGYKLQEAYMDDTCDCLDRNKTIVLIFAKEPL